MVVRDYHAEVFNPSLLKLALLISEVEHVLAEALHDESGYPLVFRKVFGEDQDGGFVSVCELSEVDSGQ